MPQIKLTLQNRITTLLILSSIILVSAFILIQLNNQIASIQRYNAYQANLSGIITKNNLEAAIRQVQPADIPKYLESGLREMAEAKIINKAVIFNPEGKIIASTDRRLVGDEVRLRDLNKIEELENLARENKWFFPEVNRAKNILDIFLALKIDPQGKISYVAKLSSSLGNIQEALSAVYQPMLLAAIIIILANILFGFLLSKTVVGPIKILNEVTKTIAEGDLSIRTNIRSNDELQELAETFNYMTEELVKMKERAENANPLTKLPGNIVIREETEKRIKENKQFTVIYSDLDNFKSFNDKYGIAKGDQAIKLNAEILKESIKTKGNPDDFLGHEGGDDFILLTTPDKAQGIADYITVEFDKDVRALYDQEDLTQGYIVAHARDGAIKQFPIMSISLAGVSNEHRAISSYAEITNIAAEVKKKAKSSEGKSVFVLDKRQA